MLSVIITQCDRYVIEPTNIIFPDTTQTFWPQTRTNHSNVLFLEAFTTITHMHRDQLMLNFCT